jgi:hypothetical protein
MSLAEALATSRPLTAEDLASMPDDGIERDLIRGELRERPTTRRSPANSVTETLISHHLWVWILAQPDPRGQVVGGEAGFRLHLEPETYWKNNLKLVGSQIS